MRKVRNPSIIPLPNPTRCDTMNSPGPMSPKNIAMSRRRPRGPMSPLADHSFWNV